MAMNPHYSALTTLFAAWASDESDAFFAAGNDRTINGCVGWFGLYVGPVNLVCLMDGGILTANADKILTSHAGAIRFSPQPLTLA